MPLCFVVRLVLVCWHWGLCVMLLVLVLVHVVMDIVIHGWISFMVLALVLIVQGDFRIPLRTTSSFHCSLFHRLSLHHVMNNQPKYKIQLVMARSYR